MEIISVKNLSKRFKKKKILESVNLSIKQGEILGIVGPSSSGKSTFIKILIGFLKPTSGSITSNGDIGFSMQENAIYEELNVKQNLNYFAKIYNVPRKERKKRITELIKQLNLTEFEKILVKELSGGTKKRVDIACSLISNPEIIALDEPFIGLDPKLINDLSKTIIALNKKGKTIIISSHRVNELSKICSRLIAIKNKKFYSISKSQINQVYN